MKHGIPHITTDNKRPAQTQHVGYVGLRPTVLNQKAMTHPPSRGIHPGILNQGASGAPLPYFQTGQYGHYIDQ